MIDPRIVLSSLKSEWIRLRETFAGTRWRSHITISPNARGYKIDQGAAASRPALKGSAEEAGGMAEGIQTD